MPDATRLRRGGRRLAWPAGLKWGRGLALVAAGLLVAGCSGAGIGENLPKSLGGLPEGAPTRPNAPGHFPAVHDIPPPRADKPLTPDQQTALENELKALRDRQNRTAGQDEAGQNKTEQSGAAGQAAPARRSR